jgi:hypothetical protein
MKSDKLKFDGKETKLPVSPFSRAMNVGYLGASIVTSSIGNVLLDKVKNLINKYQIFFNLYI